MKIWLGLAIALILFSGCSPRQKTARQTINMQQELIQKQKLQISTLTEKLKSYSKTRTRNSSNTTVRKTLGKPIGKPKKNIELKKVEDNNFNSSYMYPETKSKPKKQTKPKEKAKTTPTQVATTSSTMDKAECVSMIGQAKFDKYTQMFGGEAASIKRCKMLKAMKN